MAPKTRGASLGAVGMKKKRVVKRPAREPSPSSSDSPTPTASPAPTATQVDPLAGRVIITGRKVDFEVFEAEGFTLGRQLCEMGWDKLCSLECPTYPSLVKDFYKNLTRGDNGLVSSVRNVRINVTVDILSRLLSLPHSGPSSFNSEDRCPALSRLLNREVEEFEEILANQLSLELRLLHNICSRVLFPKSGRFDYVSERDAFVMDAVVSGKPINLPNMIIWYMADCGSKKRACLPYGMVLTKIFQTQGIAIADSEPMRNLRHTDYYSLATIHRMGFIKKDGRWERKCQTEERAADLDAPGPSERHSTPEPPRSTHVSDSIPSPAPVPSFTPMHSSASSSTSFSETQLAQLKSLLTAQKEELKKELKEDMSKEIEEKFMLIKQELYSLDDRISKMESTLGTSCDSLKTDLKKIFEELGDIGGDSEIYSKCNAELQDKIITACTFVNEKLNGYVKVQAEGMQKIIERLTGIIKTNL